MNAVLLSLALLGVEHGICYAVPGEMGWLAGEYKDMGATWVKFNPPGALWMTIQPEPHGLYQWDKLDKAVEGCLGAGLRPVIVIGPGNGWGTVKRGYGDSVSCPVQPQYADQYAAYVRSIAQRYPQVRAWEVLTEAQHSGYWVGSAEEYAALLRVTFAEVKEVDSDATVILSGMYFWDLFDGGPLADDEIERAIKRLSYKPWSDYRCWLGGQVRNALAFNRRILQEKDCYDAVEFHMLSSPSGILGTSAWIVQHMPEPKPVWIGDCAVSPPIPCSRITGWYASRWATNVFADPPFADGDVRWRVYTTGKTECGLSHETVVAWHRQQQIYHVQQVMVEAERAGIAAIGWYTWLDADRFNQSDYALRKHWQVCGLRDRGSGRWPIGDKRPVYHVIQGTN